MRYTKQWQGTTEETQRLGSINAGSQERWHDCLYEAIPHTIIIIIIIEVFLERRYCYQILALYIHVSIKSD